MNRYIPFAILFLIFISTKSIGQVAGVSTDKLAAYNAETLELGLMELEPTFSYARALGYYNQEGDFRDYTGVEISSALTFRVSYGITKNLEIAANVATQFNQLGLSAKYYLLGNEKIGFGLLAGINSDITNGPRDLSSIQRQYVFGITNHYNFTDIFSVSNSIQLQDSQNYLGSDLFLNSEFGYYIHEELLLIAGFGYSRFSNDEFDDSNVLSFVPGFNFEKKSFNVALQGQFDLVGKNINSYNGVSVSITQLLK